jgi:RimJ/RimL family protein N-acetyltransferase
MIKIRTFSADDAEHIVKLNENTNEDFLRQWAGRFYVYPLTQEQIHKRIQNTENTRYFTVLSDDIIIGMVELDFIEWDNKICSICRFIFGEQYRNKGFGLQAINLLCNYAFDELGIRKIKLSVFDFNISAYKCYIKAGFKISGEVIRPNGWKAIEMEKVME